LIVARYHMACLKSHDPDFSVHRMRDCPICGWRDATRDLYERDFDVDVEGAIEIVFPEEVW
jgi:hypothetical protein